MNTAFNEQSQLFKHLKLDHHLDIKNWGTFKDSLKAPVHRWFTYPAGFSYRAVEYSLERFKINEGMNIYDPFMGSGTTNLVAKLKGINSFGIEAHPFVFEIAKAKMEWDIDIASINKFIDHLNLNFTLENSELINEKNYSLANHFPELVLKCYSEKTLTNLLVIRNIFNKYCFQEKEKLFIFVAITALLRNVSAAATGWPYIAPNKAKTTSDNKDVLFEFNKLILSMLDDLSIIKKCAVNSYSKSKHHLILGSSNNVKDYIANETIDHVFTSPPYLNNFDYSDRTRLELYFWGIAKNWGDITTQIRSKLMTSATTQILRSDSKYLIDDAFKNDCPEIANFVQEAVFQLGELRKVKGGKKSYDLMVSGYFNDIYYILKEVYRVLKPRTKAVFVLGDSAPYGVHIPTDKLIGEIGCCIGFNSFSLEVLRKRGDKWKDNPQRHNVPLQESIVILEKK